MSAPASTPNILLSGVRGLTVAAVVVRSAWDGLVSGRADPMNGPTMVLISGSAGGTWSSPIRVAADDGHDYFVKFPEACSDPADQASVAIEMIVARVGRLIGAPVVDAVVLQVPAAFHGHEIKPGVPLTSTVAHASRALDQCDELGRPQLRARSQDDNRRRHAGVYALFDWFMGCDQQWLYDIDDDRSIYSHDHGLYLPPLGRGFWTDADLQVHVGQPHSLPDDPSGLSPAGVADTADALRKLQRSDLQLVLNQVPLSWAVSDVDLEALGWFLEERAPGVADRLEQLSI